MAFEFKLTRRVEFADGQVLSHNDLAPKTGKIWGIYPVTTH